VNISLVSDYSAARIEFQKLRILENNLAPNFVQFDEAIEVICRLIKYDILLKIYQQIFSYI
jgi:hypothetical protein